MPRKKKQDPENVTDYPHPLVAFGTAILIPIIFFNGPIRRALLAGVYFAYPVTLSLLFAAAVMFLYLKWIGDREGFDKKPKKDNIDDILSRLRRKRKPS